MGRFTAQHAAVAGACTLAAALVLVLPNSVGQVPRVQAAPPAPTRTPDGTSVAPLATTTPGRGHDNIAPSPVTELHLGGNDHKSFTITWLEADDNVGVVGYIVQLNGQFAARTTTNGANFAWFGTSNKILVQVAAVDAAGNRSQWRALYIVPPPVQRSGDSQAHGGTRTTYAPPPLDDPTPVLRQTSPTSASTGASSPASSGAPENPGETPGGSGSPSETVSAPAPSETPPSITPSPSETPQPSQSTTPSATPSASETPTSQTPTPSATPSPSDTPTHSDIPTESATPVPEPDATETLAPEPSQTPTASDSSSASQTPTPEFVAPALAGPEPSQGPAPSQAVTSPAA